MFKRLILILSAIFILFSFAACDFAEKEGNVNFGDYVIPTEADTTEQKDYDVSKVLHPDTSWQNAYALSYKYYDSKTGVSTITEGKCGNFYQSIDKTTSIITYMTQEEGYMLQYMLNNNSMTGTATVVTDASIDSVYSGFVMLSTCDPYFPVYKNVTPVGADFVANRSATRYKQVQTDNGTETKIAYIWIDDTFGFASKCELYDAVTQQLIMSWELLDFTQNVTEDGVRVNIDAYEITAE